MRRGRTAAAGLLIAALVILGSATTVLFAARSQEDKPQPPKTQFQDAFSEKGVAEIFDADEVDTKAPAAPFKVEAGLERGAEPKSTPKPPPPLTSKAGKPVQPGPSLAGASEQTSRGPGGKESGQGDVYTWYDGDRAIRVVLQEDLVAQKTSANAAEDEVATSMGQTSIVRKRADQGTDAQPVFKAESGDGLMTLPGGVLLALDADWDQAQIEKFFAGNDISTELTEELEFLDNGFLVQTEPGFPSLELANSLAQQEGVINAAPNWARELEPK